MAVVSCIACETLIRQHLDLFVMSLVVLYIQQVGSDNVALSKPTNQSDTYSSYYASLAVDGNIQTCAQPINDPPGSNQNLQCWWMVDLGDLYAVYDITIFNVASGNSINYQYLTCFTIRVGASTDINSQSTCSTVYNVVPAGGNQTFPCSQPLVGRYVSIQKFVSSSDPLSRPDTIVLCEVEVDGTDFNDVALQKSTNQSGTYSDFYSSFAVDGNIYSCAQPEDPFALCWWQVDLGGYYTISGVTIFNVGPDDDSTLVENFYYLTSFNIRVGNSPDNVDTQSLCYTFTGSIPNGGNQTFTCSPSLVGRYVTIKKFSTTADFRPDTIVLCEVIVTGTPTSAGTTTQSLQTTTPAILTTTPTTTTRGLSQPTGPTAALSSTTKTGQSSSGGQLGSSTSGSTISSTPESNRNISTSAEIAAIILGVLLGISLVFIAALICYIIKQRQQILTTEKIKMSTKESHNYEHIHRDITSSRPANSSAQDASPYEELNIDTVSTRA